MNGLATTMVLACTVCETDLGQQIRAGIFDGHFWPTLVAVLAPFPILLVAAALVPAAIGIRPAAKKPNQDPHEHDDKQPQRQRTR